MLLTLRELSRSLLYQYPIPAPYTHLALPAHLRAAASVAPPMHTPRLLRVRVRVRVKVVSGEG